MATIDQYADLMKPASDNRSDYADLAQPMASHPQINTFLGKMPDPKDFSAMTQDPEFIKQMINTAAGAPGMRILSEGLSAAPEVIKKGLQFIQPQKTADQFMEKIGGGQTAEENVTDLAKRLSFARNSAAEEALSHKRPVFESLGERPIINSGDRGEYLKTGNSVDSYTGKLKNAHLDFSGTPTLNNADALQQQMGSRIGELKKLSYQGKIDRAGTDELEGLVDSRNKLLRDQDKFMEAQDPYNKAQYDLFRSKWRNNVTPYDESPILSQIVRKGTQEGITPGEIKSIFAYPSANVKKIAQDIGPSGRNNILYNELQNGSKLGPIDLSDALKNSKQFGFQQYVDPQMEMLAQRLPRQYKTAEALKTVSKGTAGGIVGGIFGHPILGAMAAAGYKPGKDIAKKVLESIKK